MASAGGTSKSEFLVNGKYRLVRKIGSGSCTHNFDAYFISISTLLIFINIILQ